MSRFEKAKKRILCEPKDYTYSEVKFLLEKMGFKEFQKGKTSGSRVRFFRERDASIIDLHKPHPGDEMDVGAVKDVVEYLKELGEL